MDIVCPQCKTEYEFDERHVTTTGVSVQCTNCGFTFKVRRREVVEIDADERQPSAESEVADAQPWMIECASGERLRFRELATLQQWIIDRRVTRDDQISRTGDKWKPLGQIPELSAFFQAAQAHAHAGGEGGGGVDPVAISPAGDGPVTLGAVDAALADEPAFARDSAGDFAPMPRGAAWERSHVRMSTSGPHEPIDDDQLPRRTGGKLLGLALLSVLLVSLGGLFVLKPQLLSGLFKGLFEGEAQSDALYAKARELFLRDDRHSLDLADQQLEQITVQGALVRAARAEIYTVWAQHLRDEAELLQRAAAARERQAKRLFEQSELLARKPRTKAKGKPPVEAAPDPAVLRSQGDGLRAQALALQRKGQQLLHEASEKINVARAQLQVATGTQSERAEVSRALADLRRLEAGDDVLELLGKVRRTKPDDAESHYVEGLFRAARGDVTHAVAALRTSIAEMRAQYKQLLLRSAVALAMVQLRQGQYADATKLLRAVLAQNATHNWAQALLKQVEAETGHQGAPRPTADGGSDGPQPGGAAAKAAPDARIAAPTAARAEAVKTAGRSKVAPATSTERNQPATKRGGGRRDYEGLVKAGNRASEHGRTMRALDYYERALKLRPDGLEALTGLGYAQLDLQRFTSAMKHFRRAVAQSPGYGEATIGMAEAYLAMGNKSKALDYYKTYLRAHPTGRRASLARRNVNDLERALKGSEAAPAPPAAGGEEPPADKAPPTKPEQSEEAESEATDDRGPGPDDQSPVGAPAPEASAPTAPADPPAAGADDSGSG